MATELKTWRTKNAFVALIVGATLGLVASLLVGGAAKADGLVANGFEYEIVDGKAVILGCEDACPTNLIIPAKLGTISVSGIGNAAFQNAGLTGVTFPTTTQVESIGVNAFSQNTLGSVAIPRSVTTIEDYAFQSAGVSQLSFDATGELETIGAGAFWSNNVPDVTIPSSVTSIGNGAFQLSNIVNLSFAAGSQLETIENEAFESNLLTSVSLPASVVSLGQGSFRGNELTSVNFAAGAQLQTVGDSAFAYNDLTSLVVPASVTSLGDTTFYSNELQSVQFQPGTQLSKLDVSVFHENKISQITIPASVTEIASSAFAENDLTTVNFASTSKLTAIGTGALYNNKLTSFVVPVGVTTVGGGAFMDNTSLGNVRFLGNKPTFGTEAEPFSNTGSGPIFFSLARSGWVNGGVMSGRTLTGVPEPTITSQPKSVKTTVGRTANLSITVNKTQLGQGDLTYQWYKGSSTISGATKSTYVTKSAGMYKIRVSSWAGSTTSSSANVSFVKKKQSVKVKLPSRMKRNKTYRLPTKTNAGVKLSWKVKGAGKCKINKKKGTVKCRASSGRKHVTFTGTAKATSTYSSYKVSTKRRIR